MSNIDAVWTLSRGVLAVLHCQSPHARHDVLRVLETLPCRGTTWTLRMRRSLDVVDVWTGPKQQREGFVAQAGRFGGIRAHGIRLVVAPPRCMHALPAAS